MNIIWLTLEPLLPANTGGRIGVYKRLEYVARTENIYLFFPYDDDKDLEYTSELLELCAAVNPYKRTDNVKNALLGMLKYPYTIGSRKIAKLQKDIEVCLRENQIDLINVDFPHMCVNLLGSDFTCPIVLNEHNVEWMVYQKIAKSQRDVRKKLAYWFDSFRIKRYERRLADRLPISKVTFVSSYDMETMIEEGLYLRKNCVVVPVGADRRELHPQSHSGKNIVFVGKMSYGPNVEAALWFTEKVMPLILRDCPAAAFYIVGKDPSERVKGLASDQVTVTGTVDKVDCYYELADVIVLPLMNGGGVKVKLLEAASFQKYIVSTPVGVEGTLYEDGKTVRVCDDAVSLANACIEGLRHTKAAEKRRLDTYDLFQKHYTWETIGKKYLDILKQVVTDEGRKRQGYKLE